MTDPREREDDTSAEDESLVGDTTDLPNEVRDGDVLAGEEEDPS